MTEAPEPTPQEPWFEECHDCGNDTFKVRVTPYGVCGSDTEWICAKCGGEQGGVFNDPLDEIPPEILGRARGVDGQPTTKKVLV